MVAIETLKRYIERCKNVIDSNDATEAELLENEIVAVLDEEIINIRNGLSNYSFLSFDLPSDGMSTYASTKVDYIGDVKLLKSKLQAEVEKIMAVNPSVDIVAKTQKVFISHSSKDVPYVSLFVNLLEDIGLSEENIVCSSIPEYGIPLRSDIYDWLSDQFQTFDLHVIFILSPNYYDSVACLNEMGAAWVLRQKYDIVLLPEFDFPQIEGAINPKQIGIKLDSELVELKKRLNELKDDLIEEFELKALSATKWERHRDEFVEKISTLAEQLGISKSKEDDDTTSKNQNTISRDAAVLLVYAADDASGRITMFKSIVGLSVGAGKWKFSDPNGGAREEARWIGAIHELESYGLIEDSNNKRQLFTLTNNGYNVADEVMAKLNINTDNPPSTYFVVE